MLDEKKNQQLKPITNETIETVVESLRQRNGAAQESQQNPTRLLKKIENQMY